MLLILCTFSLLFVAKVGAIKVSLAPFARVSYFRSRIQRLASI